MPALIESSEKSAKMAIRLSKDSNVCLVCLNKKLVRSEIESELPDGAYINRSGDVVLVNGYRVRIVDEEEMTTLRKTNLIHRGGYWVINDFNK